MNLYIIVGGVPTTFTLGKYVMKKIILSADNWSKRYLKTQTLGEMMGCGD